MSVTLDINGKARLIVKNDGAISFRFSKRFLMVDGYSEGDLIIVHTDEYKVPDGYYEVEIKRVNHE